MEDDMPNYILSVAPVQKRPGDVEINVRLAGAPEDTAEINYLSVDELRRILIDVFENPRDRVEGAIRELGMGRNFVIYLSRERDAIAKSGLLGAVLR